MSKLNVGRRVEFKLACLVRQALCGQMPTYLADDIHGGLDCLSRPPCDIRLVSEGNRRSLRSSFDNIYFYCVRCHVRTTASETEALELPVHEFGITCLVACEHLTSVTNILKHY